MQSKLPEELKAIVKNLEVEILTKSESGDLTGAKRALDKLRPTLENFGQAARLLNSYLHLYEGALRKGERDTAKRGFQFVRDRANKKTKTYLEATGLLAIAYLKDGDLFSAEPLMFEVLNCDHFIVSKKSRGEFIADLVERFDREGALAALARAHNQPFPVSEVHTRAIELLKQGLNEDDLEENLGRSVPDEVRNFILDVNRASRKSLPPADRLLLPPPREAGKDRQIGGLVFRSVRQKLYKYICDPNSEVYQAWVHKGLDAICDQAFVANVVVGALGGIKILAGGIAVGITALVIKNGLVRFCDASKPEPFFSERRRR